MKKSMEELLIRIDERTQKLTEQNKTNVNTIKEIKSILIISNKQITKNHENIALLWKGVGAGFSLFLILLGALRVL